MLPVPPSTLLPAMALRSAGAQQGAGALSATPAPTTAGQGLGLSASLLCIHAMKIKEVKTYEYSEGDETVDVILGEISEEDFKKLKPFIRVQLADKRSVTIEFNYIRV